MTNRHRTRRRIAAAPLLARVPGPLVSALVLVAAAGGLGAAPGPAAAVPAAVQDWFDSTGASLAYSSSADPVEPEPGRVHRVSLFSDAFTSGVDGAPVVAERTWIAPVLDRGRCTGTVSTSLAPGATRPSTGEVDGDSALCRALVGTEGRVVEDPRNGTWWEVLGTRIGPLNGRARGTLHEPETLRAFRSRLVEDLAERRAGSRGLIGAVGGSAPHTGTDLVGGTNGIPADWAIGLAAGGVALVTVVVGVVVAAARRPAPWERRAGGRAGRGPDASR